RPACDTDVEAGQRARPQETDDVREVPQAEPDASRRSGYPHAVERFGCYVWLRGIANGREHQITLPHQIPRAVGKPTALRFRGSGQEGANRFGGKLRGSAERPKEEAVR